MTITPVIIVTIPEEVVDSTEKDYEETNDKNDNVNCFLNIPRFKHSNLENPWIEEDRSPFFYNLNKLQL